jgi:hypothetical protein
VAYTSYFWGVVEAEVNMAMQIDLNLNYVDGGVYDTEVHLTNISTMCFCSW